MGTPGGFVMESSSKMDDLGVPPWIGNLHNMYVDYVDIYICMCKYIYIYIYILVYMIHEGFISCFFGRIHDLNYEPCMPILFVGGL